MAYGDLFPTPQLCLQTVCERSSTRRNNVSRVTSDVGLLWDFKTTQVFHILVLCSFLTGKYMIKF
jgi:hypothetical protein